MKGFFLIDKEKGMTSFDVVRDVRRATGEKRVGHAGTLDPLATGLLLVAVGEATKLLEYFVGCDKEYEVRAKFGFVSDTFDAEGRVSEANPGVVLKKEEVEFVIGNSFIGEIEQVPPKYSALKIEGKKAYELARGGKEFEMKSRKVKIDAFDVLNFDWPFVDFRVKCGSGTYIRSLVHDLGQLLGCGAYVEELRRTVVGNFSVMDSAKTNAVDKKVDQYLLSLEKMLSDFSRLELTDADFEGLKDGKVLMGKKLEQAPPVMAYFKGKLVGVVEDFNGVGVKYAKLISVSYD